MQITKAKVMFIEVSNENEEFLINQYKQTADEHPDYEGRSVAEAEAEYRRKVDFFAGYFESLDTGSYKKVESKWSYMQCDHSIKHFVVHNVKGNYLSFHIEVCITVKSFSLSYSVHTLQATCSRR